MKLKKWEINREIIKTKTSSLKRFFKIDKLARQTFKKNREKAQITNIRSERGTIITNHMDIKRIIKKYLNRVPYDITYMWNLKYNANEHIYETKTDSQIQRKDLRLTRGG